MQGRYLTVAKALRAAVTSLLADKEATIFRRSFYYWAAFIPHGFASVTLDDVLLNQIHDRVETYRQKLTQGEHNPDVSFAMAVLTLTRETYRRLEKWEQTLSREWCEKQDA